MQRLLMRDAHREKNGYYSSAPHVHNEVITDKPTNEPIDHQSCPTDQQDQWEATIAEYPGHDPRYI